MSAWDMFGSIMQRYALFRLEVIVILVALAGAGGFVGFCVAAVTQKRRARREYPENAQIEIAELEGENRAKAIEIGYLKADRQRKDTVLKTVQNAVTTQWPAEPLEIEGDR